ncbi:anthrone oxygenase family protein [Streptomyces kronopolitis]|uniref:anthrone oxygenase family protein n=1 Tax=Streptomyces kronopolitis TaxID=1612435 RepID=UPI0036B161C5
MTALVVPLVLLANGLAAGVLVGTQLGGWPLLAALPARQYVHAHAFFATRYDPFMPVCFLGTVLGDLVLAAGADRAAARWAFGVSVPLVLAAIVISVTRNVPVNRWIRALDPQALPPDFADRDPRPRWGAWNRGRCVLAATALLTNCLGTGLLL